MPFISTDGWTNWDSTSVIIKISQKGYYELSLLASQGSGLGNIDYLKIINLNASQIPSAGDCSIDDSVKIGYPYITIEAPAVNQVYHGEDSVLISAMAIDYDGEIDSVEFYLMMF